MCSELPGEHSWSHYHPINNIPESLLEASLIVAETDNTSEEEVRWAATCKQPLQRRTLKVREAL